MMFSHLKPISSGVLVSFLTPLLLIFSSKASDKYVLATPPFYYRCNNGQTVVWRVEYPSTKGRTVSIYPFPVEEQSQVLWRLPARFAEARHSARYFIADNGQEYDCKQWRRGDDGDADVGVWAIPDPAGLKKYAKRFTSRSRYVCEGGHTVVLRITDFRHGGYRHGVMEVNNQEEVGLYWTRGTSGNFNGKGIREPGIAFSWGVHLDDDQMSLMRWFLSIDDKSFSCSPAS